MGDCGRTSGRKEFPTAMPARPTQRHPDGRRIPGTCLAALVLAVALHAQQALSETQVYKSTDARGQVTYGDKPAAGAVAVEDLGVTAPDPALSPEDQQKRLDSVVATTNRLRDDRVQREKAEAAARQAAVPPTPAPAPMPYYVPVPQGYAPQFWGYPGYHRHIHGERDAPYSIDIHGGSRNLRYDASLGRRYPQQDWGTDDDSGSHQHPDETRTTDRQPRLMRNPGR